MAKIKSSKGFVYGLLAGGIVGSVTALLFAPKAGRELRSDIASGAQQVGEQTVKLAGQVGETTTKIAGQVGETTTKLAKQVSTSAITLADKAKQSTGQVIDSVRNWRGGSENQQAVEEIQEQAVIEEEKEKELTTIG